MLQIYQTSAAITAAANLSMFEIRKSQSVNHLLVNQSNVRDLICKSGLDSFEGLEKVLRACLSHFETAGGRC